MANNVAQNPWYVSAAIRALSITPGAPLPDVDVELTSDVSKIIRDAWMVGLSGPGLNMALIDGERLSEIQHEIWSHWIKYMFSVCDGGLSAVLGALPDGAMIIPHDKVERWIRQMNTSYADLPEAEKQSDRDVVNQFMGNIVQWNDK